MSSIFFVKLFSKYFIHLDTIANAIVFKIFFLSSSLLMYRNTLEFCVLILYPITLLNIFISPSKL